MLTCLLCERVVDLAHIEVSWVDNVNPEESVVEVYCGTSCLLKVIQ